MIIYANPICANCRFFNWQPDAKDDAGICSKEAKIVDGNDKACKAYDFTPAARQKEPNN